MKYLCTSCGEAIETHELIYRCPHCSGQSAGNGFQRGNLLIQMDIPRVQKKCAAKEFPDPLDLLPLDIQENKSFPAGNTPLIEPNTLGKDYGFSRLFCKMEGTNPSGSLKDRASLLVAAQVRHFKMDTVVLASTGNAGSAMSCAGAALGLRVILFVPATAPVEKLMQSLFYGARVIPIQGSYDDAFALSLEYSKKFGGLNRNTAYNPFTIEGKKTAAIEIYNQLQGRIPDLLYIPVGDGVIYTGICKGFEDLLKLGLIKKLPRCIAVQAQGSNAIHLSFTQGSPQILKKTDTMADSIAVCSPACGEPALQYLEKTRGWTVEVNDEEILQAQKELASKAGIFVEPSSAAVWAGVKQEKESHRITGEEEIVLLLTGTGFKDMSAIKKQIKIPQAVPCSLDKVEEFIQSQGSKTF
ncbi:MAG: threonine synthase [Spirochaetaceae bacterium]|jgi:threonine synthase|nr:threonine synthase [Spirochaetaceae bacterium]